MDLSMNDIYIKKRERSMKFDSSSPIPAGESRWAKERKKKYWMTTIKTYGLHAAPYESPTTDATYTLQGQWNFDTFTHMLCRIGVNECQRRKKITLQNIFLRKMYRIWEDESQRKHFIIMVFSWRCRFCCTAHAIISKMMPNRYVPVRTSETSEHHTLDAVVVAIS